MEIVLKDRLLELLKELEPIECLLTSFLEERKNLPRTDDILRMADLDYTLFSRDEQLEKEEGLAKNRGDEGSKYILFHMGLEKYIETYYKDISYPQDILSRMNHAQDVIITAGFEQIQSAKVEAMGLSHFPLIITKDAPAKILACIRYVLYTAQIIPQEIVIYEDRPQYFIQYRELIEGILGTKLTIMQVEMDGNEGYKKIEQV